MKKYGFVIASLLGWWVMVCGTTAAAPSGSIPLAPVAPTSGSIGTAQLMLGDPNGDGQVTVADAVWVLRVVVFFSDEVTAQSIPFSRDQLAAADVTKDGKLDVRDVIQILRIATGLVQPAQPTISFGPMVPIDWNGFEPGISTFESMVERPDGKLIVLGVGVAIVDPATGKVEEETHFIHEGGFPRYSPLFINGRMLAINNNEGALFAWSTVQGEPFQVTGFLPYTEGLCQVGDEIWASSGGQIAKVDPDTLKLAGMVPEPASFNPAYSHAWLRTLAYDSATGLVYGFDPDSVNLGKDASSGKSGKIAIHVLDATDPNAAEVDRIVLETGVTQITQMVVIRAGNTASLLMLANDTKQETATPWENDLYPPTISPGKEVVLSLNVKTRQITEIPLPAGFFCTYITPRAGGGFHAIVEKRWLDRYGYMNTIGFLSTLGIAPSSNL